ncbi:MAG: hypothetical protein PWQ20_992 [Thermotogaceae bacterium]|nr:hypothetical protein [Thermotogaceae bacterium]
MTKIIHLTSSISIGGGFKFINLVREKLADFQHILVGRKGELVDEAFKLFGKNNVYILPGFFLIDAVVLRKILINLDPEIVHLHGRGAGLYGRLFIPRKYWNRTIYTIHGFNLELLPKIVKKMYLTWERLASKKTALYHFVSQSEKDTFLNYVKPKEQKLRTIYNCIDTIDNLETLRFPNYDNKNGVIRLLFIGRLSKQKGVDILIEALKIVLDEGYHMILDIYGSGKEEKHLKKITKSLGLSDRINFIGQKKFSEIKVGNYDALVVPSRFEGMPFVVLEGIASGLPIIATPARGIVDILPNNSYGYISPSFSPEDLAKTLLNFYYDKTQNLKSIRKKVLNSYSRLKKLFSCEKTLKMLYETYLEISRGEKFR